MWGDDTKKKKTGIEQATLLAVKRLAFESVINRSIYKFVGIEWNYEQTRQACLQSRSVSYHVSHH